MTKYLKMNSKKGYLEDSAEIAHAKFNNMRHVVLGCMLGDFDENGNYVVSPEIVTELISLPKFIVETLDNIDICESLLKLDRPISFAVTFQNDRATLSLLEKVNYGANFKLNSGTYSDVNEYILAQVETSGAVDKNAIYRMWNVSTSGGESLDIFHMDEETLNRYRGIVKRFKFLLSANKLLLAKEARIEEIESNYFNKMMAIIAKYPKLKKVVDQEIKKQMEEKGELLRFDKPNLMKTMNEIVEDAVHENIDILSEEEQKSFAVEKHNAENEYNINIQTEIDIKSEKLPQKDVNAESIVVPLIDTHREEEKKDLKSLAEEFIAEEKKVEEKLQDDMATLITGKLPPKREKETTKEKEEATGLIAGLTENGEEKKPEKAVIEPSDFQKAVISEAGKEKNKDKNPKLEAIKGVIAIATEKTKEDVVVTGQGVAIVQERTKEVIAVGVDKGKVTTAIKVSKKETDAILKTVTGHETRIRVEETQAEVAKNKTKQGEKETVKLNENDKKLVVEAGKTDDKTKAPKKEVKKSTDNNKTVKSKAKADTKKKDSADKTAENTKGSGNSSVGFWGYDYSKGSKDQPTKERPKVDFMTHTEFENVNEKIAKAEKDNKETDKVNEKNNKETDKVNEKGNKETDKVNEKGNKETDKVNEKNNKESGKVVVNNVEGKNSTEFTKNERSASFEEVQAEVTLDNLP